MVGCSAPNCSNRAVKGGYKMKRFPADPAISQIWINNVKRADWNWNPPANFRNCRLCEVHFDDSQFEYKHTPEGTSRCLKPGAIPTLFDMQIGSVCRSHSTSLHSGRSRRHKKIVGEFNPMLCLSNLEQRNQPLPGLSKHTSISTNIFSATSTQNIIDMNFFKKNQTKKLISSLPIASYIDEQTNFSQFSNQIHYNYHGKHQATSCSDSSTFPSKTVESIHQTILPRPTNESIVSMIPVASHHLLPTESPNVSVQPLLQPGDIKVEYVEEYQNCDRDIGEQMKPTSPQISSSKSHIKISNENIQNPLLQEQMDSSAMYPQNHLGDISSLISHNSKEPRNYSDNSALMENAEIECNTSKSGQCHRLIRDAENPETNKSFNESIDIEPHYTPVSESVSADPRVTKFHERISPNIMQKRDRQLSKSRINHKCLSMENLHRKLKEEKRKCQKLRLENQKLRKQLGPLRNLQNWINRLLNTNENSQFDGLNFRENSTDTLQKALKLCSTVCGYLSNVVSLPFYSNITRSI